MKVPQTPMYSREYHLLKMGIAAKVIRRAKPPPENRIPAPFTKEELSNFFSCSMLNQFSIDAR